MRTCIFRSAILVQGSLVLSFGSGWRSFMGFGSSFHITLWANLCLIYILLVGHMSKIANLQANMLFYAVITCFMKYTLHHFIEDLTAAGVVSVSVSLVARQEASVRNGKASVMCLRLVS